MTPRQRSNFLDVVMQRMGDDEARLMFLCWAKSKTWVIPLDRKPYMSPEITQLYLSTVQKHGSLKAAIAALLAEARSSSDD